MKYTVIILLALVVSAAVAAVPVFLIIDSQDTPKHPPFNTLSCDDILTQNIQGIQYMSDDPTFSQERIFDCLEEELESMTEPSDGVIIIDGEAFYPADEMP